ncbi:signal peptide prediction [Pseudoduganella ginsengisoli]|uniref:signal peptide prediction n=1 Tax=Pseudoduganella ginsengisoli TaxID=1462440 RepID=UPI003530FC9C
MSLRAAAAYVWAAPCTAVGLALAALAYLAGARARRVAGVVEVALWPGGQPGPLARRLPFTAITFGHTVIALTWQEQHRLRAHEREHVRQYERWGIVFFAAYPLSSLWQMLRGRHYYWDNWFEVQARAAERLGWPPRRP